MRRRYDSETLTRYSAEVNENRESAMLLRRAEGRDVEALVELRGLMFEAMGATGDPEWRKAAADWFAEHIDDARVGAFVVDLNGEVVACAVGVIREGIPSPGLPSGTDVAISTVCTRPRARGRGYARAASSAVLRWARAQGAGRAELMATRSGRHLYESLGFEDADCPAMRARLTPSDD